MKFHIIALILCWPAAQVKSQEIIAGNFANYQETVWLECERHLYFTAEIIRFSAKVFEKDTYRKSSLSSNIRIELLNSSGEPIDQLNLQLDDGKIKGQVQIPSDSKTGIYYLRAYTNWMRNFPLSNFGNVALKVVNPNEPLPEIYEEKIENFSSNTNSFLEVKEENQKLMVSVSDDSFKSNDNLRLAIHQSYTLILDTVITNSSGRKLEILEKDLPNGIFQLSLVRDDDKIIAKRLWSFYQPEKERIEINMADSLLKIRNSYSMEFPNLKDVEALTVSVGIEEPNNPLNDFVPGLPGWNCNYEIPNNSENFKRWLLANSYPDDLVLAVIDNSGSDSKNQQFLHFPETHSGIISGKVIDRYTQEGQAKVGICITVLDDNYFDAAHTDKNGQFYFALPGQTGSTDLILNFTTFTDTSHQIELMPFFHQHTDLNEQKLNLTKAEIAFLEKQNIYRQLKNIYKTNPAITKHEPHEEILRETFFHPPDYTRIVDDYIKLANIRDVLYEVVPTVSVRNKDGQENIRVYNGHPNAINYETLVLLDGIPLTDQSLLLELPPERIQIIEVKNKLYIHGRSIFSSVVNFVSPNRDYAGLELPESSVLTTMGLPAKNTFMGHEERPISKNLPVLDNSLLWHSEIKSDSASIELRTNDLKGVFRIYVNGLDSQGNWTYGSCQIRVE